MEQYCAYFSTVFVCCMIQTQGRGTPPPSKISGGIPYETHHENRCCRAGSRHVPVPQVPAFAADYPVQKGDSLWKIAEHWDVMETIADQSTWQNQNGKF